MSILITPPAASGGGGGFPTDTSIVPLPAFVGKTGDGTENWILSGRAQIYQPKFSDGNTTGTGANGIADSFCVDGAGVGVQTGTTATGGANKNTSNNDAATWADLFQPFQPGFGWRSTARFNAVSDGTNTYWSAWGAHGGTIFFAPGSFDNGVYFIVNSAIYSDNNIRCITRASGSSTVTDSGVAVTSDTAILTEYKYDSTGQVRFWINNALVATHTTNIPGTAAFSPYCCMILKSAGTTNRVARFSQIEIPMDL